MTRGETRAGGVARLVERVAVAVASADRADDVVGTVSALVVEALPVDRCEVTTASVVAHGGLAVPLVANGERFGLLTLFCDEGVVRLAPRERASLEAVAALVAVALRNRRLEARASMSRRDVGQLVEIAASLNAASSLAQVIACIQSAYRDLVGARQCWVTLLSEGLSTTVSPSPGGLDWVPEIARRPGSPVPCPAGDGSADGASDASGSAVLFPLRVTEGMLGFVVVEPDSSEPATEEDLEAGQAVADLAAGALARAQLADRLRLRVHEAEALSRLAEVVASSGGLAEAVRALNRVLPAELGIRARSISLANAQLRATVGGPVPHASELEAVRSWRAVLGRGGRPQPRPGSGDLLVPMVHRSKVVGVLRVALRKEHDHQVAELLLAVGAGCAELVHKAVLRQHLADSERRLAVAAERDRIAQDLHDSVGQLVTGMGMRLAQYVADAPDRVWRARLEELLQMAGRGSREVRQSVYALLFLDAKRGGLQTSIRELCRKFETTTGIPVRFLVRGTVAPVGAAKEDALFRAAHEALVNIERHARASLATVQLAYEDDAVTLSVRDDGVGLGHRDPFGRSGHFGIRAMQRRLEDAGGDLRISNVTPRGVHVEAVIPRRKRTAHVAGSRRGR
jgi:signal transduction histidine kinase